MDKRYEVKRRIIQLTQEINRHRRLYHTEDTPEISDQVYDSLILELEELENLYPEFRLSESPTTKVGGVVLENFQKVNHVHPQWSFDDVFDEEGLLAWQKRGLRILEKEDISEIPNYVCELKIDGLKVILTYKKGVFLQGATRGDGVIGEDITENLLTLNSIPKKLKESVDCIVVGEAWMPRETFDALNIEREKEGKPLFANPRNAAAGSLRQLDTRVTSKRNLQVFLYEIDELILNGSLTPPQTQVEVLQKLKELGFPVNEHQKFAVDIAGVEAYYRYWSEKKNSVPYDLDGIVVKVNQRNLQKALGYTGKSPRFGVAYKFPAEQATSILKNVQWQVGRTGALTPVALIQPLKIAGTVVSRASLHNYDEIERLDLRIGDTIIIQKAGDIIPEVVSVVTPLRPKRTQKILAPATCPACGKIVVRKKTLENETANLYCTNSLCPAKSAAGIRHAVSRKAFNIPGFGGKTGEQLLESGLVQDLGDLFLLRREDVLALPRFAEKSVENLFTAIEGAKKITPARFLFACGVPFIGEETAGILTSFLQAKLQKKSEEKPTDFLHDLQKIEQAEWEAIEGVGIRIAESISSWSQEKMTEEVFKKFEKGGVILVWPVIKRVTSKIFSGETWVLTGELDSFTRAEAGDIIKENGGSVTGSVSSKTSFVLVGKDPGSKVKKAISLGIPTVSEVEFQSRLNQL